MIGQTGTIKKYKAKKKKLQENLIVSKKFLGLAERIKKYVLEKFYKQLVQNTSYFNKKQTFIIRNKQKIDKTLNYWLKKLRKQKIFKQKISKTGAICC